MSKILVGAFIADIHFDAGDDLDLYNQLKDNFIEPISKLPKLDMIVLGGDTYNSKVQLESRASKLSMKFINSDLVDVAKDKEACIRIIKGTHSHDNDQLDNFRHLEERVDVDVKIINKVERESYKGFNFLYIPEEYIKDQDEYYKPYMQYQYDMAFGHGMFEAVSFTDNHGEINMKNAPVFKNNYFKNNVKGPVLFGHIHTNTRVNDQVYYPGSFSRWIMGEEKKKGFFIFIYNRETGKFLVLPYWNKGAKKYVTMEIDPFLKYPIEVITNSIDNTIKSEGVTKLRINISYFGNDPNKLANIKMIKDFYSGRRDIIVNIKNKKIQKIEAKKKETVTKFNYIFDKGKPIEEKVSRYIKEEFDYNISDERVKEILVGNILDDLRGI